MQVINQISAGGIVYKKMPSPQSLVPSPYLWLICQHSEHHGWVFPKGFVGDLDKNETNEAAALREVEEEGGIKAKIISNKPIITNYEYTWPSSAKATASETRNLIKKTVYYFLMEYISGDPKNHDWEMSDAKFVSKDEVIKTLTYQSDKDAYEKVLQTL